MWPRFKNALNNAKPNTAAMVLSTTRAVTTNARRRRVCRVARARAAVSRYPRIRVVSAESSRGGQDALDWMWKNDKNRAHRVLRGCAVLLTLPPCRMIRQLITRRPIDWIPIGRRHWKTTAAIATQVARIPK